MIIGAVAAIVLWAAPLQAQEQTRPSAPSPSSSIGADTAKFFAGAALALAMHESGHLVLDGVFGANPTIKSVSFGPFPFFAIAHRPDLPPREEFAISSAGFWVQESTDEWLFAKHPDLRHEHAPLAKGMLAFNVLASVGYAAIAFAKAGPYERDTRGMAASIDVPEPAIGLAILAPAALDAWRYYHPNARWAVWMSRIAKAGAVVLIAK